MRNLALAKPGVVAQTPNRQFGEAAGLHFLQARVHGFLVGKVEKCTVGRLAGKLAVAVSGNSWRC